MKPITHDLRNKIKLAIKNRLDISDLIKDVNIKGEDFSYAIIKNLNRVKDDFSGTRFTKAQIGEEGKTTVICNNIMRGCFFDDTVFKGHILLRRNDLRNSNFSGAVVTTVEYQYSDFRGCKFCETAIRFGTNYSLGSKFSPEMFEDLGKMWGLDIKVKE